MELRFMHGQSYGFNAYFAGDTVAFVKASTMERFAMATVTSVKRLTDRTVEVALDRPVPQALELDHDSVENMSCTPEVEIRNCHFT
ncbi:alpha-1,3-galactosidase-related protein, partial [Acinetobacter baumannii]|uniref:alpha-1,3-galactosidase-related protein n=1 Tax=Acinetobacter baumannii TaxID=470 RepID=UPI003D9E63A3